MEAMNMQQPPEPSALSETVQNMAMHVYDQAHLLLMDISSGTSTDSLQGRLGCISGAVTQLEHVLSTYGRMNVVEPIHIPEMRGTHCKNCDVSPITKL